MFPGKSFDVAVARAKTFSRPLFHPASFSTQEIQLCPQTKEHTTLEALEHLRDAHPDVVFQLHANVKRGVSFEPFDASLDFSDPWAMEYVAWLKDACELLRSPRYSWHASGGKRANTFQQAVDNTLRLQDFLQRPVALEGLYPSSFGWALCTVSDYESLLDVPVHYVIDVSHLYICHCQDRPVSDDLMLALLSDPRCLEIHLSHNDGRADQHCDFPPDVVPFGWKHIVSAFLSRAHKPAVFIESRF